MLLDVLTLDEPVVACQKLYFMQDKTGFGQPDLVTVYLYRPIAGTTQQNLRRAHVGVAEAYATVVVRPQQDEFEIICTVPSRSGQGTVKEAKALDPGIM